MANLKSIGIHGWLKDLNDDIDSIEREFDGSIAVVMEPPEAPAINVPIPVKAGVVIVPDDGAQTPGPIAMTLRDPISGDDDGKVLTIYSVAAEAHTVSLLGAEDDEQGDPEATKGFNGDESKDLATFSEAVANVLVLLAYGGVWYVLRDTNATLSTAE